PRPPINTPAGCFMSNTVGAIFGMIFIVVGTIVGSELGRMLEPAGGGETGGRLGLMLFGVFGFFMPWRRWLFDAYRRRQVRQGQKELDQMMRSGELPAPKDPEPGP
ncbi:MAG: hypothetical protein NTZ05_10695, partial [Chloroflexi bacterium]|nr:hypothetical protein [Chloroflexota bacterium]